MLHCPPGSAPRGLKPGWLLKPGECWRFLCPPESSAPSSSSLRHSPFRASFVHPPCAGRDVGASCSPPVPGCWECWGDPQAHRAPSPASLLFSSSSNMHHPLLSKKDFPPFFKGKAEIFISLILCLPQTCLWGRDRLLQSHQPRKMG